MADIEDESDTEKYLSPSIMTLIPIASLLLSRYFGKHCSRVDRWVLCWLLFDMGSHLFMHTPFVMLSLTGTTVNDSRHWIFASWKEYGRADRRWLVADPVIVAQGIPRMLLGEPLCGVLIFAIAKNKPYRHLAQIVFCVFEVFSSWMLFCPEILQGSPNLSRDSWVHFWLQMVFFQAIWVILPLCLIYQSSLAIISAFSRSAKKTE